MEHFKTSIVSSLVKNYSSRYFMGKLKSRFILLLLIILNNSYGQTKNKSNTYVFAKDVYLNYSKINSDSLKAFLHKSPSVCNLALVDSVINKFISKGDKKSLIMLEKIRDVSDGELSEYLVEKTGKIAHKKFKLFFEYLYAEYIAKKRNSLEGLLIESWSSEASISKDRSQAVKKIKLDSRKSLNKTESDYNNKSAYLEKLLEKIKPDYLD